MSSQKKRFPWNYRSEKKDNLSVRFLTIVSLLEGLACPKAGLAQGYSLQPWFDTSEKIGLSRVTGVSSNARGVLALQARDSDTGVWGIYRVADREWTALERGAETTERPLFGVPTINDDDRVVYTYFPESDPKRGGAVGGTSIVSGLGIEGYGVFEQFAVDAARPAVNRAGQVVFGATTRGKDRLFQGIFRTDTEGNVSPIEVQDDGDGKGFGFAPAINEHGDIATFRNNDTLLRFTDGKPIVAARIGDSIGSLGTLLGFPTGDSFLQTGAPPLLSDDGALTFVGACGGGIALLSAPRDGKIEVLIRTGEEAPGGGTFTGLGSRLVQNADGAIAFTATVDEKTEGVFVRSGGSVYRVVDNTQSLRETALAHFEVAGIDADNRVTVAYERADGVTGVLLATRPTGSLVAAPEPATLGLLAIGVLLGAGAQTAPKIAAFRKGLRKRPEGSWARSSVRKSSMRG
jgi:hypothetical protein